MRVLSLFNTWGKRCWIFLESFSVKAVAFLQDEKKFYTIVLLSAVILLVIATYTCNYVSYPIIFFGFITAMFAFQSYKFTNEKFRLDLMQRREASFVAMKTFLKAFKGIGFLPLPEENLNPMDEHYYRVNTINLRRVSKVVACLYKQKNKKCGGPIIEDIHTLYGEDVRNIFREARSALFILENNWPKSPTAYVTQEYIRKNINPNLNALNNCQNELPKILKKYMYFGEY